MPPEPFAKDDFTPFSGRVAFQLADLLYRHDQMPAGNINELMELWAANIGPDLNPPFANKQDLYDTVDSIDLADVPWQSFSVSFNGKIRKGDTTPWKHASYEVWFRDPQAILHNQLGNPDFTCEMDFAPKEVHDEKGN